MNRREYSTCVIFTEFQKYSPHTNGMFDGAASHVNSYGAGYSSSIARAHDKTSTGISLLESSDPELEPKGSQYMTSNCVLLTYFNGDCSAEVDEHFSRALSQPSSFSLDKGIQTHRKTGKSSFIWT